MKKQRTNDTFAQHGGYALQQATLALVAAHSTRSAKLALIVRKVFVTPSASVNHAHTLSAQVRFSVALGWHFQCKCMRFKTLKVGLHFQCGALQQARS